LIGCFGAVLLAISSNFYRTAVSPYRFSISEYPLAQKENPDAQMDFKSESFGKIGEFFLKFKVFPDGALADPEYIKR
jgi:hypothetical protein